MKAIKIVSIILGIWLLWVMNAIAQLSASALMEYQLGNLPHDQIDNVSSIYTKLNLVYSYKNYVVGIRGQQFQSSEKTRSYQHIAQRYFEWQNGPLKVRLGNFYSTLGRGLVLRGFELPNVIFEQRTFRRRYAYYRDFDGVLVQGQWNNFEFTALRGEPLNNEFPPGLQSIESRVGVVEGGQVQLRPLKWLKIGDAYLRYSATTSSVQEMNSTFAQFQLGKILRQSGIANSSLNLYFEHARINSGFDNFFSHEYVEPHATFFALNFSIWNVGFTAEFKEYRDFETGINLPPIGFKEHSYYLLNRTTHELLADNERGNQFELSFRPASNLFFVLHRSQAVNDYPFERFEFADNFIESTIDITDALTSKVFFDQSSDEIKSVKDQLTGGLELEWMMYQDYGIIVEFQHQKVKQQFGEDIQEVFKNTYATLTLTKASMLSVALVLERSKDPAEIDDPDTPIVETDAKYWFSFVASYEASMNHQLSLFAGSRRGGLACVSGTCYEVLPFDGVEFRWIVHF